jgi:ribosome-associated translation inhibitor RaiA
VGRQERVHLPAPALAEELTMTAIGDQGLDYSSRGQVPEQELAYAEAKLAHLARHAPGPILARRLRLAVEPDPARERPAIASASFDVDGHVVRTHVAAPTLHEAIDRLESRLRRRLDRLGDRSRAVHLRHRDAGLGEWQHGNSPTHRPEYFDRPPDERQVIRRKSFALASETPEEAAFDLEMLDHDFFLFQNAETGEPNVISRAAGSGYELIQPTPVEPGSLSEWIPIRLSALVPSHQTLEQATALLDLGDEPFVFFLDEQTGEGTVVYRRYDGHYGVIGPTG